MKPVLSYLIVAIGILAIVAALSTIKWLKDQTIHEQIRPEKSIHLHKGDVFYIRWGYPEDIRVYKCVDINSKGYYVKWRDAGELDSHSIEFMPINIIDNPAFKLISQDTVNDMDTASWITTQPLKSR